MEYFTHDDCRKLLESYKSKTIGSVLGSDDSHPYIKEVLDGDVDRVYDCINVWCSIYEDVCHIDGLSTYIKAVGFIEAIRNASEVSAAYKAQINTEGVTSIDYNTFRTGTPWFHLIGIQPVRILQALDYPKRILIEGSNLDQYCKDEFVRRNKGMKAPVQLWKDCLTQSFSITTKKRYTAKNGQVLSIPIGKTVKVGQEADPITWRTLYDMKKHLSKLWGSVEPDLDYFKLPAGSTYEGKKEYVDKFVQLSKNADWVIGLTGWDERFFLPGEHDVPVKFCNKLVPVPKSWKAKRIVCPEETARQVVGYTIAHSMRKKLKKICKSSTPVHIAASKLVLGDIEEPIIEHETTVGNIDLTDQSRNRVLAQYASIHDNLLATVDFSAASDSISVQLVKLVTPEKLYTQLDAVRATKCKISDKGPYINLNTFMTMGHSDTFDLETGLFRSMGVSAVEYCWIFLTSDQRKMYGGKLSIAIKFVVVYGDDVIIPDFAYDYFVLIASKCGFKVNEEKSFGGLSGYRESCGVEYYKGVEITVAHYPRGTSSNELAELIGQQHCLCNYPRANAFLIDRILKLRPSITFSYVGSPYSDIWVPESRDEVVPINIYDNGKTYVKVSFQNQDVYIPIKEYRRELNKLQFQYAGNGEWYGIHLTTCTLPCRIGRQLIFYTIVRVKGQNGIKFSKVNPSWSDLWEIKELKEYFLSQKCNKDKPPIGYWSWDEIREYSLLESNPKVKTTKIAKLVEQSASLYADQVELVRLHDASIRNPKDTEPYTVHTVVKQQVSQEKNATRLQQANQLAYLLKLSEMARRPKELEASQEGEDLLYQDYRDDNKILDGDLRLLSLCNVSKPKYMAKKVAPEKGHDYGVSQS
jgi:hypothetical protein